jgi:hypothetical protein
MSRSGTLVQPIPFQGYLLKPGAVPGQWAQRYFVLTPVQQELSLQWWPDSSFRLGRHQPAGCLYLRPTSTVVAKGLDTIEISGVHNPEKPQKTTYCFKSSPTSPIGEFMSVVGRWLAVQCRERSLSLPASPPLSYLSMDDPERRSPSPLHSDAELPSLHSDAELPSLLVRALFSYPTSDDQPNLEPGELSFPSGALIRVAQQSSTGWWRGCVEGSSEFGWFPSNFVRPVSSRVVVEKPGCGDQALLFLAVAVHDYNAVDVDPSAGSGSAQKELTIRANDAISVTAVHANGWWFGVSVSGESGWFPSNYVEITN